MKKELIDFCLSLDIEYVGIAPTGPYHELAEIWSKRVCQNHITGFEERDFNRRIDAKLTLENVQSVIVCLFPYFVGNNENANLSKSSFSIDYHTIAKAKLEKIGEFLKQRDPQFEYKAFVDNGPLVDRYLAHLAGLGYFGVNGHIITDKYGSYVFIGYIINNYPFEPDKPQDRTCIKCGACVRSCPGCAILGDFDINPLRCRSYITQKKGELTEQDIEILCKSPLVYGCDICQDVCPHNADVKHTPIKEFRENIKRNIEYSELQEISNKEFLRRYKNRAFSWRGKSMLIRNFELIEKFKNR
ncbi:MAG TPA: tRNA epoxyqueuosine(34) reductase QueG [Patescibacteria group bacterium]|nr:tRNA epoxyqueuosine(34) reductase QueG [Patescibacteria group bacterium]